MTATQGTTVPAVMHALTRAAADAVLIELRRAADGALPAAQPGDHIDVGLGGFVGAGTGITPLPAISETLSQRAAGLGPWFYAPDRDLAPLLWCPQACTAELTLGL